MLMKRDNLGNGVIAYRDPGAGGDTGAQPPGTAPVAVNFGDLNTRYNWGLRGTIGRSWGAHAFEFSAYYMFQNSSNFTASDPGRLDVLFGVFTPPGGFEGNNNLWLQADTVQLRLQTTVANAEWNYRYLWNCYTEFLVGLRYFYLRERFDILTEDDRLVAGPNPLLAATYSIRTDNHIVGPQIGFEFEKPLVPILSFGCSSRMMVGPNFVTVDHRLERGDGLLGPGAARHDLTVSSIQDLTLYVHWWLNDHIRLKLGYQGVWAIHVHEAPDQVNFDPNIATVTTRNEGNILYHGPLFEFQLAF
jgi:hypothetical protein